MTLQHLLGVDKRDPLYTIFRDTEKQEIHIYYGGILYIEINISRQGNINRSRKKKDLQGPTVTGFISDQPLQNKYNQCTCGQVPDKKICDKNFQVSDNESSVLDNRSNSLQSNYSLSFYHHLGILIFAPYFKKLSQQGLGYLRQWLASVLLGAQNIEQTKTLHHGSMQAIFGRVIKTPYNQRVAIKALVEQNNKDDILRFNAGLVNAKSDVELIPTMQHPKKSNLFLNKFLLHSMKIHQYGPMGKTKNLRFFYNKIIF